MFLYVCTLLYMHDTRAQGNYTNSVKSARPLFAAYRRHRNAAVACLYSDVCFTSHNDCNVSWRQI